MIQRKNSIYFSFIKVYNFLINKRKEIMEASKVSFFKKTSDAIKSELSPKEKGKLRLERIKRLCPESGATLQEMMRFAGYDPGIPKQYQAGASFINYHRKNGNLIDIPRKEYINGTSKNMSPLIAPNPNKITVKKSTKEEKQQEINVEKSTNILGKELDSVTLHVTVGEDEYDFKLSNINQETAKLKISQLLGML